MSETYFYINPGLEKPFRYAWEGDDCKVQIPYPENLRMISEPVVALEVTGMTAPRLPAPLFKKPGMKIGYDESRLGFDPVSGLLTARYYGYAGMINKKLTIVPPVIIDKNNTRAWLYLKNIPPDRLPDISVIEVIISQERFAPLIPRSQLVEGLRKVAAGEESFLLIARGKPRNDGYPAYVEPTVREEKQAGKVLGDGRIDFKERNTIKEIARDEEIGVYYPEQPKIDGYDIYGEKLVAEYRPRGLRMGDNLYRDEKNPSIVRSKVSGYLKITAREINVIETLEIPSDINYDTGNIDFQGSIIIKGGIANGFSVTSGGDVTVSGTVDGGIIKAKGNIHLKSGFIGRANARLEAEGSIEALYLQNAKVTAGGSIIIKDFIYHSELSSNDSILCHEKRGIILGGSAVARRLIDCKVAGNNEGIHTRLLVGMDQNFEKELQQLKQQLTETEEKRHAFIEKMTATFGQQVMRNPRLYLPKLDEARKQMAVTAFRQLGQINRFINDLQEKLRTMERLGPEFDFEPKIIVRQVMHTGVQATINERYRKIESAEEAPEEES